MSLAAFILAATSTLAPVVADIQLEQLDADCRVIRRVDFVQPTATSSMVKNRTTVAKPVSKPKRPKPRRLYKTDPVPAQTVDEEVICDEGAIAPLSALPLEPEPEFTPVPADAFERLAAVDLTAGPAVEAEDQPGSSVGWLVASAPPVFVLQPIGTVAPIPEPSTTALLAAGLAWLLFLGRRRFAPLDLGLDLGSRVAYGRDDLAHKLLRDAVLLRQVLDFVVLHGRHELAVLVAAAGRLLRAGCHQLLRSRRPVAGAEV